MKSPQPAPPRDGWLSRERAVALALVIATCVVLYLCYRLILPFLPSLAWALALAVIAHPLHRWLVRRLPYPNLAAGLSVLIVALVIVGPAAFVTRPSRPAGDAGHTQDSGVGLHGTLAPRLEGQRATQQNCRLAGTRLGLKLKEPADRDQDDTGTTAGESASVQNDPLQRPAAVERAADILTQGLGTVVSGTAWLMVQLFITAMTLFYFFRDQHHLLRMLRSILPLSEVEMEEVFVRVDDTIHATIYGSIVVALVQGGMGGLMFWWLGLPSPLLWGAIMALLAIVPVLGTFVIWAPTAVYLALSGEWSKALILAAWGGIAIALIDNLLYPFLVGKRLRFHTLIVFFAIAGGLLLFGASGVILGPVLLALADALLQIWRHRTAFGGTIEQCNEVAGGGRLAG